MLCVGGIVFIEPLMRAFGASDASLSLAEDYAFWMFVAALANLPAQSMNCAARAESSVKISSIAVITGALLNVVLDPIFMFDWGLGMGVEGASYAFGAKQEERVHHIEGHRGGTWLLMDFSSVVVHIFMDEARKFYDLERLWGDAEEIPLEDVLKDA